MILSTGSLLIVALFFYCSFVQIPNPKFSFGCTWF